MKKILKSKELAIILSYISIIVQTLSTIILTRVYLDKLGTDTYGLYQMIYSVAHYILILDLGISATMIRFVAEFDAKKEEIKKENFLFHFLIVVIILLILVGIVGFLVNMNIENIYTNLTIQEYSISHKIFLIMISQIILTIICNYFEGFAMANDNFSIVKILDIIKVILDMVLVIIFLNHNFGLIGIAVAGSIVIFIKLFVLILYDIINLKIKIKFHYLDITMLNPAFLLMIALLLQAIVGHVNSSVDKTILGIMATKKDVAVYSIAAIFVTMFNTLPSAISSIYQTTATKLVVSGANSKELSNFIIKPGRFQFVITGGFIAAFILFGKDFICCWAGNDVKNAWLYTLVIIIPNMIPLIQNVCLSILNAMDKRIFRSLILVSITIINIILTVFLIKYIGPLGAPIATGIAYIIGHIIIMNIYYIKKIKLEIKRIFKEIFKNTIWCIILTFIINVPIMIIIKKVCWTNLIIKSLIFCVTYLVILSKKGLNDEEKQIIKKLLFKFHIKLKI